MPKLALFLCRICGLKFEEEYHYVTAECPECQSRAHIVSVDTDDEEE